MTASGNDGLENLLKALKAHPGAGDLFAAQQQKAADKFSEVITSLIILIERVKNDPRQGLALATLLSSILEDVLEGRDPGTSSHLDSVILSNDSLASNPAAVNAWLTALGTAEQPGGWTVALNREGEVVGFNKLDENGQPVRPAPQRSQPRPPSGTSGVRPPDRPAPPAAASQPPSPTPTPVVDDAATTASTPPVQPDQSAPQVQPRRRAWGG